MSKPSLELLDHQHTLEKLFNKNQTVPRIKAEFTNFKEFDFADYMQHKGIPIDFGMALMAQMALHKRCDLPTLVGIMKSHCEDVQECANLIETCAEADLVDWVPDLQIFVVKVTIAQHVQEELDRFQYPLPFVVPPKKVKSNRDTGMYMSNGSIILKKNHHDDDVCLDHINRCNAMQFKLDDRVITMVKNQWRNLDKAKPGETNEDFMRRRKAFEKYDRTAKDVMKIVMQVSDTFHLTHKYCKRGRTYCQGYHVSYQGTAWNKAVIVFANAEVIK